MEETITISKSALEELIAKEVASIVTNKLYYTSQSLFNDVKVRREDIQNINSNFEWINQRLKYNNSLSKHRIDVYPHSIISLDHFHYGYDLISPTASFINVHEFVRKLSLAVFGKTLNSHLDQTEYEFAKQCYREFTDLFLKLYEERLHLLTASLTEDNKMR